MDYPAHPGHRGGRPGGRPIPGRRKGDKQQGDRLGHDRLLPGFRRVLHSSARHRGLYRPGHHLRMLHPGPGHGDPG